MHEPRLKKIRRLGTPLPGLTRKEPGRLPSLPGMHGAARRRPPSGLRLRLEEKQKVRWHYGISERQLQMIFAQAQARPGQTGEELFALLERRLDNVVFRLGLAPTIPASRQLIGHGHVLVNGARVDRAGYRVTPGDEITVTERARQIPDVVAAVEKGPEVRLPQYLAHDPADPFGGRMTCSPVRADVPFIVNEKAIVEFYAR